MVPQLASQMTISGEDLNARPILRNTDILEAAPGLAVVQHGGGASGADHLIRARVEKLAGCGTKGVGSG